MFLIGDAFLKHFYSVYDFDEDTLSLGINMHSEGKVSMYKPGDKATSLASKYSKMADDDLDDLDNFVQVSK